jgi:hypothetical protein
MRQRDYLQEDSIDIGTSGTKTYNLDYDDPITQLDLFFEATNGATDNKASPFERCISKIELVDGGTVLWDLPGEVALAAFATDAERMPYGEHEEAGGATVRQQIPIRFGRWLFDRDFAFDPRRFQNPQLKFTFDEATVNTAGNDGFVSDSWAFTLGVRLMEGLQSPGQFLSYRTVESFTSVAGGVRRVEMPVDRPIRYLICRAYEAGVAMRTNITHHKLSENGGKFLPFDLPARDFINRHCETFAPLDLWLDISLSDAVVSETWLGLTLLGQVTAKPNDVLAAGSFYDYGEVYGRVCDMDGTGLTDQDSNVHVHGWGFHNVLMYAFGERMTPDDWYIPEPNGKLDYYITDGDAGADVDICVQQVYLR